MLKLGFAGMVPANWVNKVSPNFNTHKINHRCPIGSSGYTLKREFAVALYTFKHRAILSAADCL
jgi:hypothetical protein